MDSASEPKDASARPTRFPFAEGVRAIGAIQVLLNHYASAFLPVFTRSAGTSHYAWEGILTGSPVFLTVAGSVAVCAFLLISGFVLTQSYLRHTASTADQIFRRVVRLLLPATMSIVFATSVLSLFSQPRSIIAPDMQSTWAERLYIHPPTLVAALKDLLLNVPLLGYRGASLFDGMGGTLLTPVTMSTNPPLWTLSVEFWGSILVVLLVKAYRALPRIWFWLLFAGALVVTGTSYFTLFLVGFAGYLAYRSEWARRRPPATLAGLMAIAGGLALACRLETAPFDALRRAAGYVSLNQAPNGIILQNEVSAVLLLAGLTQVSAARRVLSLRPLLWLGQRSFSLYLVHFPLLFTVGLATFAQLRPLLPYGVAIGLTTVVGGSVSLAVTIVFERWVDRPALRWSRRVSLRSCVLWLGRRAAKAPRSAGATAAPNPDMLDALR